MKGKTQTHPSLMTRSDRDPSEIVDYIEGAMNLEYTDAGLTWKDYEETTDTFEIAMTSGHAIDAAVGALYNEVRHSASAFFYRISEEDKFPYLYDVVSINATSTLFTLSVHQIVGKVHRNPGPFGSTDYWSVIYNEGKCAPESGGTGSASDRISEALNDYFAPYGGHFYTNETQVSTLDMPKPFPDWGILNPDDPTESDFIIDYRTYKVFCEHNSNQCDDFVNNGIYCLDPDQMNYYFQSIVEIMTSFEIESSLSHEMSRMSLVSATISNIDYKTWECGFIFGTVNFYADGNLFPFALPVCC